MSKIDKGYKEAFLKVLESELTIKTACAKTQLSRNTVYRWMKESKEFAKEVKEAIKNCVLDINDDCETKVLQKIKADDFNAIKFWLKYHHVDYKQSYILTK